MKPGNLSRCALIGLLLVCAATSALAEVSTDGQQRLGSIILGIITEGADPIPLWQPLRPLPPGQILNPDGATRGDGRPDMTVRTLENPTRFWPVVVWAYNNGSEHDVAFSEWDGAQWTPVEFLTTAAGDELDPR
ncbi:MAG: hypothetical protein GY711_27440, partial [bacterium]|nr:hypothetical protein [bacterium]